MSNISEEIFKRIEEKKIAPKSKIIFVLKNYLIWLFFIVFIVFSSLAVCTILYILTTNDWDIRSDLHRTFLKHVFISIPYFWFFAFGLLIIFAYYIFANTRHGYRRAMWHIFLGSIIIGLFLGVILFSFGIVDSEVHESFSKSVPFYDKLIYYKEDIWCHPQNGLLGGKIIDIKNKDDFTIVDLKGNIWHITGENILWPNNIIPQKGIDVKIIGKEESENSFCGNSIR